MREGQQYRDREKFRANFDEIDFSDLEPLEESQSGHYVVRDDTLVPVEQAGWDALRERDATNIRSICAGVDISQVDDWNKRHAGEGVRFEKGTGDAIFKDRQSKLAHLAKRGMVDFDEIKGGHSRDVHKDTNKWMGH